MKRPPEYVRRARERLAIAASMVFAHPVLARHVAARRFARDARGVAALEFAMILPLMMLLYMGVLELSMGYQASRKVSLLSRTLSDVSSQSTGQITAADMSDLRKSANWILAPFPIASGQVRVTVSSVIFKGTAATPTAFTDWSVGYEGVKRPCTQLTVTASDAAPTLTTVPSGVASPGTTVIIADVSYDYKPLLGGSFKSVGGGTLSQVTLAQTSYMKPRNVAQVTLEAGIAGANYCGVAFP